MSRLEILQNKNQVNNQQERDLLKFMGKLPPSPHPIVRQNKPVEMPSNSNVQVTNEGNKKLISVNTRLLVSNLASDMTEVEFVQVFSQFGKMKEFFMNHYMKCAFVMMETCENAEMTRVRLDRQLVHGQIIHVRYPTAGGIAKKTPTKNSKISVQHLHPLVSNELLEKAFGKFGKVEGAVVIVDNEGQSTTRGIVEFNNELSAQNAVQQIQKGCFMLTHSLRPVYATIIEEDSDVGLPEQKLAKSTEYYSERQTGPRFAVEGSFDDLCANTWKGRYNLERMQRAVVEEKLKKSRETFEEEMRSCQLENISLTSPATSYDVPEEIPSMNLEANYDEEEPETTNGLNPQHGEVPDRMEISYTTSTAPRHFASSNKHGIIPVQLGKSSQIVTGQIINDEEEEAQNATLQFSYPPNESAARTRSRTSWTGREAVACPQCQKRYFYKTSLTTHMRTYHKFGHRKCGHCSKLFVKQSDLDRHVLVHTKRSDDKNHICHHCGEAFSQAGILRRHVRIHTGENLAKRS